MIPLLMRPPVSVMSQKHIQSLPIVESTGDQSTTQNDLDLSWQRYVEELLLDLTEETWDIETRLIPPPMPTRRIKVKFRFTGKEAPRIFFDPERD